MIDPLLSHERETPNYLAVSVRQPARGVMRLRQRDMTERSFWNLTCPRLDEHAGNHDRNRTSQPPHPCFTSAAIAPRLDTNPPRPNPPPPLADRMNVLDASSGRLATLRQNASHLPS